MLQNSEVPLKITYNIIIIVTIYCYLGACMVHLWRSKDSPVEWILSFHLFMDQTGVARPAQQHLSCRVTSKDFMQH